MLAVSATLLLCPHAARAEDRAPADHAYALRARLDPERGHVEGHAAIRFRNHSTRALHELMFHLYPNAFAHLRTVFMREGGAAIRGGRLTRKGGIDVTSLVLADGTDLLARADLALLKDDATQMRVPLPAPLQPGATLLLSVDFRVRLPSLLARMGRAGEFFMIAQWFPKLARLEPDGRWASFPYHGLGEFYADFADYDLTVEVPARYRVAAPGRRVELRELAGGARRERYLLPNAIDVAWAADPHLRRTRLPADGLQIDVYAPPGHAALARCQAELMRDGLAELGARLGPYPHDRIVLVLPPAGARGAFGMEYPGLMVGALATWHGRLNPAASVIHDLVTAHELAHQWFPMLAASDEVTAPVLDEGLAQWLGLHLIRERHRFWLRLLGLPVDVFVAPRAAYSSARNTPSSLLPAHRYRASQLAPAVYLRPALALERIRRTWGEPRLWSALGRYARAHRFGHPTLSDLMLAFDTSYWPGFSARVLRPMLEGSAHEAEVARAQPAQLARAAHEGGAPPLLARMLLWAQWLLAGVGP
jgi:hypothetical protein